MADYDVGAVALSSPPSPAVITTYRPAVSVRNNGIHDALAYGTLRIYSAGLLIFATDLYSGTIKPGETKPAQAIDYWKPPDVGKYQVIAYVTCDRDQYEPNNSLPPTLITVTTEPPPPPPIVALHASQHEEAGEDEMNVDGLPGRLAEGQHPFDHHDSHQAAGSDQLDVSGLKGQLADPQPTAPHANEKHTIPFTTAADIAAHNSTPVAHVLSTNLEKVTNKGAELGYAPLGADAKVPVANLPPLAAQEHGNELHTATFQDKVEKGAPSGYAPLNVLMQVPEENLPAFATKNDIRDHDTALFAHIEAENLEKTDNKGAADGYAPLDGNAKVPTDNLPALPPAEHGNEFHSTNFADWRGEHDDATPYVKGNVVFAETILYVCIRQNTGHKPPEAFYWDPVPAAEHGNETHTATFQDKVEKGVPSGYAPLNDMNQVPDPHIGTPSPPSPGTFLRSDRIWALPEVAPAPHGNELHTSNFEDSSYKGAANGYAPLDADAKVPVANLPPLAAQEHGNELHTTAFEDTAQKGVSNGYCPLDEQHYVPSDNLPGHPYVLEAYVGQPNGVAPLDAGSKVPSVYLPAGAGEVHGNELHSPHFIGVDEYNQPNGVPRLDLDAQIPLASMPPQSSFLFLPTGEVTEKECKPSLDTILQYVWATTPSTKLFLWTVNVRIREMRDIIIKLIAIDPNQQVIAQTLHYFRTFGGNTPNDITALCQLMIVDPPNIQMLQAVVTNRSTTNSCYGKHIHSFAMLTPP